MRPMALALLLLMAASVLAGCTGTTDQGGAPPATNQTQQTANNTTAPVPVTLTVKTSGQYPANPGFDPKTLEVTTGANVTVTFTNAETLPAFNHNWVVEGVAGAETKAIAPGKSDTVSFVAPAPGEYTYACTIGDHKARGMVGKLVVKAA